MIKDLAMLPLEDDESFFLARCAGCGDPTQRPTLLERQEDPHVADAMRAYCRACAREVLGIKIQKFSSVFSRGTGGGWRVVRESKTH